MRWTDRTNSVCERCEGGGVASASFPALGDAPAVGGSSGSGSGGGGSGSGGSAGGGSGGNGNGTGKGRGGSGSGLSIRVKCPKGAGAARCKVLLVVETKKKQGKPEAVAKVTIKAGKSKLVPITPKRAYDSTLSNAKKVI